MYGNVCDAVCCVVCAIILFFNLRKEFAAKSKVMRQPQCRIPSMYVCMYVCMYVVNFRN